MKGSSVVVCANQSSFDLGDYEIIISPFQESNLKGFTIEKTGENPFYKSVSNIGEYDEIFGVKEMNSHIFVYGYNFRLNSSTQYDSLVYIFDMNGTLISKIVLDFGEMEIIEDIYFIDDIYLMHTEQRIDCDFDYLFSANYFSSFDVNFNHLKDLETTLDIVGLETTDRYLLLRSTHYGQFELAIRSDLTSFTPEDNLNIVDREIYTKPFFLEFINGGQLNDDYVEHGVMIDYPGNYIFDYGNQVYHFTLMPTVLGLEQNKIYTERVTPIVDKGNILLNNDVFISGTEITKPGNYELLVKGVGDYEYWIEFTIAHHLSGIINHQTYYENVILTFTGDGYINNQYIESPFEVVEPGDYILKIKGENNYLETYYFQISEEDNDVSIVDFIQKIDIFVLVVVVISGIIVLKKSK